MRYILISLCCVAVVFSQEKDSSLNETIQHLQNLIDAVKQNTKLQKQNTKLQKQIQDLTAQNKELKSQVSPKGSRGWTFGKVVNNYAHRIHVVSLLKKKTTSTNNGWYDYKSDLSIYVPQKGYIDFSAQGFFTAPDNYRTAYWWMKVIVYGKVAWTMKWNADGVVDLHLDKEGNVTLKSAAKQTQVFAGDTVPKNRPFRFDKWRYPEKFYRNEMDKIYSRIPAAKKNIWEGKDTIFNDKNWSYHQTNNDSYPVGDGNTVILTPDDRGGAAGVVWYKKEVKVPFAVAFEYSIYDDDGGRNKVYNSADGIAFMFAKNAANYDKPPVGSDCGFVKDGTGYGVFFTTYENRRIVVRDGKGDLITDKWDRGIYTHGKWRKVKIVVYADRIEVYVDGKGKPIVRYNRKWNSKHNRIGFAAATGGADSKHEIRNVLIAPLD
ncbi:lectin-like domain-containing protein [Candidatus Uabimicrobium amorphum]|uniref:lectin-like domain-containing protein n=1 Tax=Uabimicrobium amorphum TaxID=2596890 RepID=UPI0034A1BC71